MIEVNIPRELGAHVTEALAEAGIEPDIVCGCSVGAAYWLIAFLRRLKISADLVQTLQERSFIVHLARGAERIHGPALVPPMPMISKLL